MWWEYKHAKFRKGRRELMSAISRKKGKTAKRPLGRKPGALLMFFFWFLLQAQR